ncbi:GntR family transcriptional regulator [Pseudochrobactrum sp. HB0163]|uniref:GntR family transcriptional regulator n=1 Tax=Pseudochrobactrum sp. HB0163 TaxID=3450708 RepID=UPI003F6E01DA
MNGISELQTLEHHNLGEIVYRQLSQALMRGRFAPNTRLTIRELAASLGTSVTPVRDALLRLIQDEALIQKTPRDIRVPVLDQKRYEEIRSIRVRLEGLAARQAAQQARKKDITRLWKLVEDNDKAMKNRHWSDALAMNHIFHSALVEIAEMPVLNSIINRLWLQMGPLIADAYQHGGRAMIEDHYKIVQAIEARDPAKAEDAVAHDILTASDLIISRIKLFHTES